jgi:3-phosphoshikimate 1-carboxyvinyltransferase
VKSAILLAGLYADGVTTITEPTLSRDHSERMLAYFGAKVERNDNSVSIAGGQRLVARDIEVPGDISSAAFFIVYALITEESDLLIKNVGINPTRSGVIDILEQMGGNLKIENRREVCGEPVGDIRVKSSKLRGIEIKGDLIPRAIDELPVIGAAAAYAEGTTTIGDAKELRVKETDRIATLASELRAMDIAVTEHEDGAVIVGGKPKGGVTLKSHGDHRIAMTMTVAASGTDGITTIEDVECIDTSFPGFEELIKRVSIQ